MNDTQARNGSELTNVDATVLKLSEVRTDNDKFRIDARYFSKAALVAQARVEQLRHVRFGDIADVFRKGIFDIKADSYVEAGVPFIRIGDLGSGLIDTDRVAYISPAEHTAQAKTALHFGDIVLSKTAYAAASFVNVPECNVSQDTIAVTLKQPWRDQLPGGFIVAFLRSRFGLPLMQRQFQGNVQEHLALPDARKILIPLLEPRLRESVHAHYLEAERQRTVALSKMAEAEATLLAALGLATWQPSDPLTYTRNASEVLTAKRWDAAYFSPRVTELFRLLGAGGQTIGHVAPVRREAFTPLRIGEFDYVEISDVRSDGTVTHTRLPQAEAPSRATQYVRANDVITSTVRPIRRLSALIEPEQDGFVCSSGFVALSPRDVAPELLLTYLRLPIICELMDLHTSATMYPAISERDLLAIPFLPVPAPSSSAVVKLVKQAHAARKSSNGLLEEAKLAVETAIEKAGSGKAARQPTSS